MERPSPFRTLEGEMSVTQKEADRLYREMQVTHERYLESELRAHFVLNQIREALRSAPCRTLAPSIRYDGLSQPQVERMIDHLPYRLFGSVVRPEGPYVECVRWKTAAAIGAQAEKAPIACDVEHQWQVWRVPVPSAWAELEQDYGAYKEAKRQYDINVPMVGMQN